VSKVYISTEPHQLPIIYREEYNVHFGGVEKLHPFDAAKWGHIFQVGFILSGNYNEDEAVCGVFD
jgi:histone deacetylase 11